VTLGKLMNEAPDKRTGSLLSLWRLLGPSLVPWSAGAELARIRIDTIIGMAIREKPLQSLLPPPLVISPTRRA
jgi:hypothetical protein